MKKLNLKSFKAHKELEIDFDDKSFLLYGDNGAGKSSIYDALKIEFFEDKLFKAFSFTPEEREEKLRESKRLFNNKDLNNDFEINLEKNTDREYQVFMLDLKDTEFEQYLNLNYFVNNIYFDIPNNYLDRHKEIRQRTNQILKIFLEDIRIAIDKRDDYHIKITDKSRNIIKEKNVKKFFNEAKLNLVVFALLFSIIELFQDEEKKRVLILDDFITSLDMSNRTFLMKHILETFRDKFQIVILTHNVYFYNLIMYLVNDIYKVKDNW